MSASWKTVRVFISSTFRDMHAERDHLVKVVFPALRERLEKHRVYLIDIDLRWGVTREQAENDQVLDLCLQQIDECRPFFIGILGERYGWVPTRFPVDALKHFGWIQHHTGKSVTELEIIHGVLQNPPMRRRAFFHFRDPQALQSVPESIRREVYGETDPQQIENLAELKGQIRNSGYPAHDYPARWGPKAYDRPSRSQGRLVGLEAFGERVRDQLWQAIQEEFQLPEQPAVVTAADPLTEEQDYHDRFMESRLRVYVGREQINDTLIAFADGNDPFPCLVTGPPGLGKSAALARFVRDYQHKHPQTLVIPHFIGASPRSTNLRDMLRRFCQVLNARHRLAQEVPEEVAQLAVTFRGLIAKVPTDGRVLLVLDAMNQLDEADRAQELYWLPPELPPQVKVIASCITGTGTTQPVHQAFRARKHCPVQLAALSDAEQREIIRQVPSLSAKTLDDEQVRLLLSNPAAANPLFLLVALEELRGFAPYERLSERIAAFPREGDTVTAIFTQVIERLEEEFNPKLVETVLTLLASARRGLSEQELQELLAPLSPGGRRDGGEGGDGADDLFPVLRQLRPYLLSRAGLIDFYHQSLLIGVGERYLLAEEPQQEAHACLAEYFRRQDNWLESLEEQRTRTKALPPTLRPANSRKMDELPWQQLHANQWDDAEHLLVDLSFLEAKAEAGMGFDLVDDFARLLAHLPPERRQTRTLRLVEEALRSDIHFLTDHPASLFQCLWNRCWWYDTPEAAQHYDPPENGWPPEGPPWGQHGSKLHSLAEAWRAEKERQLPGFRWVRSLRPPEVVLGTSQRAVLRGHQRGVTSLMFTPDGDRIVSGARDGTVRVWSADSGITLACMRGHVGSVWGMAVSPDGFRVVSGGHDRTVRLWDAVSGTELACLRGHEELVRSVAYSHDGRLVASGSHDSRVCLWDVATNRLAACLCGPPPTTVSAGRAGDPTPTQADRGENPDLVTALKLAVSGGNTKTMPVPMRDPAEAALESEERELQAVLFSPDGAENGNVDGVALSPDGRQLASLHGTELIRLWDLQTKKELDRLRADQDQTTSFKCLTFSPDSRQLAVGAYAVGSNTNNGTVLIWDVEKQTVLLRLEAGDVRITAIAFAPDGRRVAVASEEGTVCLWDLGSGAVMAEFGWGGHKVRGVTWAADGQRLACGLDDGTVRVFAAAGTASPRLKGETSSIDLVVMFSPRGRYLVTREFTTTVWDARSGVPLSRLAREGEIATTVASIAFSSYEALVATGTLDGKVLLWDTRRGKPEAMLPGHEGAVWCVAALESAGYVSIGGRTVNYCSLNTKKCLAVLDGLNDPILALALAPDERSIAFGADDGSLWTCDLVDGSRLRRLSGHVSAVRTLAFSPDGQRLASGSWDRTVRLWDVKTSRPLHCLAGHADLIRAVAFDNEGRTVISVSADGTVRTWDVDAGTCVAVQEGLLALPLTAPKEGQTAFRALARVNEVFIEAADRGAPVGYFPATLSALAASADGKTWVGAGGHDLYLFTMEEGKLGVDASRTAGSPRGTERSSFKQKQALAKGSNPLLTPGALEGAGDEEIENAVLTLDVRALAKQMPDVPQEALAGLLEELQQGARANRAHRERQKKPRAESPPPEVGAPASLAEQGPAKAEIARRAAAAPARSPRYEVSARSQSWRFFAFQATALGLSGLLSQVALAWLAGLGMVLAFALVLTLSLRYVQLENGRQGGVRRVPPWQVRRVASISWGILSLWSLVFYLLVGITWMPFVVAISGFGINSLIERLMRTPGR